MILKRLTIKDFLSVRGTVTVDIDHNVTILLGSNDHGKSNLLHALQCLNQDTPITEAQINWEVADAEGDSEPRLEFHFHLTVEEQKRLLELLHQQTLATASRMEDISGSLLSSASTGLSDDLLLASLTQFAEAFSSRNLSTTSNRITLPAVSESDQLRDLADLIFDLRMVEDQINASSTITIVREGVNSERSLGPLKVDTWSNEISQFLDDTIPRVEFFQTGNETLPDSVTSEQITTDDFEFLQGIFYYAGLDPIKPGRLFEHTDPNHRKLEDASRRLNAELRRLWAQGVDLGLTFTLSHRGSSIDLMANDPSVKSRPTRMSKRSTGVTQFFRLSVVLHARRTKNPANKYIYLFDEPGIFLHPKGQKDLIQVFEQLAGDSQIIYATHSLFLLNQNFPERHRLIMRDHTGTHVDQKPYRNNWQLATDALGVHLNANILFSPCVLLVEGDSDALYIYELYRHFNCTHKLDVDCNMLGIYAYSDSTNLRYLIQTFKRDGSDTRVLVLLDGDKQGKDYRKQFEALCGARNIEMIQLIDGLTIEDYAIDLDAFGMATLKTINELKTTLSLEVNEEDIKKQWNDYRTEPSQTPHQNTNNQNGAKAARRLNRSDWFTTLAKGFVRDGISKIALARNYVFECRSKDELAEDRTSADRALTLCRSIQEGLKIPPTRAKRLIISDPKQ